MEKQVSKTVELMVGFLQGVRAQPQEWSKLHNRIEQVIFYAAFKEGLPRGHVNTLVHYMDPKFDGKLLSVYANADDLARDRRTVGKPAKLLRKFCDNPDAKELEKFAVWFNDCALANDGLTVKTCTKPETFARIYKADIQTGTDALLGHDRKSLSSSCMRYEFNHLPQHPAWVYGSGDFTLAWIENAAGKVCARVVICTRTSSKTGLQCFVRAPIYTNSNAAADMLETWCEEQKTLASDQEKRTWLNAKILRVEVGGGFLAPYFDRDESVRDTGEFLVVSKHGDFELTTTHGTINEHEYTCNCCGYGICEDTGYAHENFDGYWCQDCFYDEFSTCVSCQEPEHHDQTRDVDGNCVCDHCLEYSGDYVFTVDQEWHHVDNVIFDVDGDAHEINSDTWFESDVDGEIYNVNDKAKLPEWFTDEMTVEQAFQSGHWNRKNVTRLEWRTRPYGGFRIQRAHNPHMIGEGMFVTVNEIVWTLKEHLEWDGCEIVNNQLELFDM